MSLTVRPVLRDDARAWLAEHHSHLSPPLGWLFAVGVHDGERLCTVATLERPARSLQNGTTACISRVATDRTPHAASKAIAALSRAAIALGYTRLVSYTLLGESGACYRAAGWWLAAAPVGGGEWDCAARKRKRAEQPGEKARWEYGPAALPRSLDAEAYVRERIGKVPLPARGQTANLFAPTVAA